MPPRLSERARRIEESPTLAVMAEAKRLVAQGVDVVDLGPGEPDFPTPEPMAEAARRAIRDGKTRYTESSGTPELRRALAEAASAETGATFGPARVIVGAGGKQPLSNACLALFEAGDEVIVPSPYWVSYPEMVRLADARPVFVETDPGAGFAPRAEAIRAAWTGRTRGVILSSPSNPTGGVVSAPDLEAIVTLAAERGATVIFDECYREFVWEGPHVSALPLAARCPDAVAVAGTFSKTFAMTGWRVGWLLGSEALVSAMGRIQSHTTTNACSVSQEAALAALSPEGRASVRPMIEEYRRRRRFLVDALAAIRGFRCAPPAGAFYAFPDVSALFGRDRLRGSGDFARALLERERVAVVPGAAFGADRHIRLSYATSLDRLEEGVLRIRRFVEALESGELPV